MFRTLRLVDGDISFNNLGKLEFIENKDSITQSIQKRLNTIKGSLFYNLDYGLDADFKRIKKNENSVAQIQSFLDDALLGDERIASVILTDIKPEQHYAKLQVVLTNNTIIEMEYNTGW